VLRNDSIGEKDVPVEASLWLHRDQDVVAAMDALRAGLDDVSVSVAETSSEATRLLLSGSPAPPARRAAREGELREAGLRRPARGVRARARPARLTGRSPCGRVEWGLTARREGGRRGTREATLGSLRVLGTARLARRTPAPPCLAANVNGVGIAPAAVPVASPSSHRPPHGRSGRSPP
jgi:hypothetical protein